MESPAGQGQRVCLSVLLLSLLTYARCVWIAVLLLSLVTLLTWLAGAADRHRPAEMRRVIGSAMVAIGTMIRINCSTKAGMKVRSWIENGAGEVMKDDPWDAARHPAKSAAVQRGSERGFEMTVIEDWRRSGRRLSAP